MTTRNHYDVSDITTRRPVRHSTSSPTTSPCRPRRLPSCIDIAGMFFKWIKRHLRIKLFFGTSENIVKTQIWIAISCILKHPHPIAVFQPPVRMPGILHGAEHTPGVRHYDGEAPVRCRKAGDALRQNVGIERTGFGRIAAIVHITQRDQFLRRRNRHNPRRATQRWTCGCHLERRRDVTRDVAGPPSAPAHPCACAHNRVMYN